MFGLICTFLLFVFCYFGFDWALHARQRIWRSFSLYFFDEIVMVVVVVAANRNKRHVNYMVYATNGIIIAANEHTHANTFSSSHRLESFLSDLLAAILHTRHNRRPSNIFTLRWPIWFLFWIFCFDSNRFSNDFSLSLFKSFHTSGSLYDKSTFCSNKKKKSNANYVWRVLWVCVCVCAAWETRLFYTKSDR